MNRHRTRALVKADGREIGIQQNPAVFALVGQIQEETHRFAIEFHRRQQAAHLKSSALDAVPGVGPKRREALLRHFKSVKAVREATPEQLSAVVPPGTARAVYDYFTKQKEKE